MQNERMQEGAITYLPISFYYAYPLYFIITQNFNVFVVTLRIPVAELSRARVCGSSIAGIVGLNPAWSWMFVYYKWCVLSCRSLCDGRITRSEESYWQWYVIVCDLEASRMRRSWPAVGCCVRENKTCWFCTLVLCQSSGLNSKLLVFKKYRHRNLFPNVKAIPQLMLYLLCYDVTKTANIFRPNDTYFCL